MAGGSRRSAARAPRIHVIAGVNGAGKSSIGGEAIRAHGASYYNPDEVARDLRRVHDHLSTADANAHAWRLGKLLLERAIAERKDFAFETTLGGASITELLKHAAAAGFEVHAWYIGLADPALHVARVRARVALGGHDIPAAMIHARFETSRLHLIELLPGLASLRVFDNSAPADPAAGDAPRPVLLLRLERGRVVTRARQLAATPAWAKPIVAAALKRAAR